MPRPGDDSVRTLNVNYRHIYHAGNFADVFKHVFMTRILLYLCRKPKPLHYIDTHSGIGLYDLSRPEARALEWQTGIGRLRGVSHPLLQDYLDLVGPLDENGRPHLYPGSPVLAQKLLRAVDRLSLADKHPADFNALKQAIGGDRRVLVVEEDGYKALIAWTPPRERRGLVLIDPPFEQENEYQAMAQSWATAWGKWREGIFALWYPLKDDRPARLAGFMIEAGVKNLLQIEFELPNGTGGKWQHRGLNACGFLIANPPFLLEEEAKVILPLLNQALAMGQGHGRADWLARS